MYNSQSSNQPLYFSKPHLWQLYKCSTLDPSVEEAMGLEQPLYALTTYLPFLKILLSISIFPHTTGPNLGLQ